MIKKLTALGDSLGLVIEKPILDLLGIDEDTPLEVKTNGHALIIMPTQESRSERVRLATERLMTQHDETLRKLAQ
ncbi:AbrB/MazE/SpoVT family DNA-binding domain-containing protein [Hyalangium sp.]|uniref:AbrB/MazE/SpoVT family DNA-binding domain-containing protein n=1 Tax=Hyalangium sp. TaxID=2028555 RepID=UPI002D5221FD|nr:AbrB/MazE/SpoVT family DNA-binding domain-containing protein [Hyalangium sp.]HYH98347.1 AbrB/MazE/SpoVT family DNA-binding domain-containing protein [Hyalangium sp.]